MKLFGYTILPTKELEETREELLFLRGRNDTLRNSISEYEERSDRDAQRYTHLHDQFSSHEEMFRRMDHYGLLEYHQQQLDKLYRLENELLEEVPLTATSRTDPSDRVKTFELTVPAKQVSVVVYGGPGLAAENENEYFAELFHRASKVLAYRLADYISGQVRGVRYRR